jgi:hypothetical protein
LLFAPLPGSPAPGPTTAYATSHLFVFGDLNFRLQPSAALPDAVALAASLATATVTERAELAQAHDQLTAARRIGTACQALHEGAFWAFKPTYKYRLGAVDTYE